MFIRQLITAITFFGLSMAAIAQNPYASPDDLWLSLSGIVVSAMEDSFRLDYGDRRPFYRAGIFI